MRCGTDRWTLMLIRVYGEVSYYWLDYVTNGLRSCIPRALRAESDIGIQHEASSNVCSRQTEMKGYYIHNTRWDPHFFYQSFLRCSLILPEDPPPFSVSLKRAVDQSRIISSLYSRDIHHAPDLASLCSLRSTSRFCRRAHTDNRTSHNNQHPYSVIDTCPRSTLTRKGPPPSRTYRHRSG